MSKPNVDPILKSLVDRLVNLDQQKAEATADAKDIYTEAKSKGYSTKALRAVVKRVTESNDEAVKRRETDEIVEHMLAQVGSFENTRLGQFGAERAA